jgi:AcrR family transcriptional regulator
MSTRGRRPLGSPDAREAVLDAARELFAELGFERTTMRAVGSRAGVDPALIYHYFGGKDGLLSAALEAPAGDLAGAFAGIAGDPGRAGEELVRRVISLWEGQPEFRGRMLAMLRTALSHDHAAQLLRDVLSSMLLAAIGDALAADRRELRAALIGSHMGGLMLARYVLKVPGAATAAPEDLVQAVGPTVQRYLSGTIAPAEARPRERRWRLSGQSRPRD